MVASLVVGCAVQQPVVTTNPDGSQSTNNVFVANPQAMALTQTGAAVAPALPPPYGWILGLLATGGAAVAQTIANVKNKKVAIANKTEAEKWQDIGTTIIQGVEAIQDATAKAAAKKSIAIRSKTDGNADIVHVAVQQELS